MMDYSQRVWATVGQRPRLTCTLHILSHLGVLAEATVLLLFLYRLLAEAPFVGGVAAGVLFVGFAAVTLWRQSVHAPRPYEVYVAAFPSPPKRTQGASFPSRHAFSAFSIATLALLVHPLFGAVGLLFALLQGYARFALGIHFLRDVCIGAAVGCAVGCVGGALSLWLLAL